MMHSGRRCQDRALQAFLSRDITHVLPRNIVSMTEANQNFSKVARLVDDNGSAIILKNNKPRYLIIDFEISESMQTASRQSLEEISRKLISQNRKAYEELAK